MTDEDSGVTLPEVNRNVIELRKEIGDMAKSYVPLFLWEENRKNTGERIGALENELAERRKSFTNNLLYPLVVLIVGTGVGALATKVFGG